MNKKTISKINLFFSGLLSRMEENRDFFKDITIQFKSGTKIFPAKITQNDTITLDYQAVKRETDKNGLWDILAEEFLKYDEAKIIYTERGAKIVIDANDKKVNMRHEDVTEAAPQTSVVQTGREYVVNPALAKELLTEIGILAKNGKIKNDKIRKYNQIDYFVELMDGVLKEIGERDEYVILDAACGKSYLSFVLNFYLREILKKKCRFIGVDYSKTVIDASKRMAKNLGYNNMEFIQEDLTTWTPNVRPDIVVSLHACDTATDMALGLGIRSQSRAIVSVPCCHKDILKQYSYEPFEPIMKYGILKARLADTLTDGIRAAYLESVGYKVSMIEYISPLETPKNIMIRAVYTGKKSAKAKEDYENLKKILHVEPAIERFLKEKHGFKITMGEEHDYGF
ncbi:MAG: SAM-dependent methyltransferase [Clostridia bacterium]|nr:SAM-dependent methyltransferase [Clostridia bacterium]